MNEHQQIEQLANRLITRETHKGSYQRVRIEAIVNIERLVVGARVDELKNLAVQPHTKHASRLEMCIPVRHRNSRITALTASKSEEKEV